MAVWVANGTSCSERNVYLTESSLKDVRKKGFWFGRRTSEKVRFLLWQFLVLLHTVSRNSSPRRVVALPLAAVNVMTTMFPKLEMAMKAESIRSGWVSSFDKEPKVNLKNKSATLFSGLSWASLGTTTIWSRSVSTKSFSAGSPIWAYICNIDQKIKGDYDGNTDNSTPRHLLSRSPNLSKYLVLFSDSDEG